MNPEDIRLAYLLVAMPVANTYLGGAMITDGRGLPVEFRYTEPIQPTRIQRILYGQVLSTYIKREVILDTLLGSLENDFGFLLVEDDNLLDDTTRKFPVIRIGETQSSKIGQVGDIKEMGPAEILLQVTPEGSPIRLQFAKQGVTQGGSGENLPVAVSDSPPVDYQLLIEAARTMDLYEPLRRIDKALEAICQEAGINENQG